jgi:hypothetical protein
MKYLIIGNLGQWTSCVLFGVGIATSIFNKWNMSDSIITLGAVVFSAFTKIKLIHYEIIESQRKRERK